MYLPIRLYVRERGNVIELDDPNVVNNCRDWYSITSKYNPPTNLCESLLQGWDGIFFIEDFKPLELADKDYANVVIRYRVREYLELSILHGAHYFTIDVYYYGRLLTTLYRRYALRYNFEEVGTFKLPVAKTDLSDVAVQGLGYADVYKKKVWDESGLAVTTRVGFGIGATSGVRVVWAYSPDGTNYDDINESVNLGYYYDIAPKPSSTSQATFLIPYLQPYVRIVVQNRDNADVTVSVWTAPIL